MDNGFISQISQTEQTSSRQKSSKRSAWKRFSPVTDPHFSQATSKHHMSLCSQNPMIKVLFLLPSLKLGKYHFFQNFPKARGFSWKRMSISPHISLCCASNTQKGESWFPPPPSMCENIRGNPPCSYNFLNIIACPPKYSGLCASLKWVHAT